MVEIGSVRIGRFWVGRVVCVGMIEDDGGGEVEDDDVSFHTITKG